MQAFVQPLIARSTNRAAKRPQRPGLLDQKSSLVPPAGECTTKAEEVPRFQSAQVMALSTLSANRKPVPVASPLSCSQEMAQLDTLLANDQITEDQRSWSSILPIPDNSMAPALVIGGYLAAYLLDPKEYASRVGKVVAVRLTSSPDPYQIGRLKSINRQSLTLAYDSADVADLILPLRDIRQLCEGIYSYGNPVL